ncbi:hypothetical protein EGW08_001258, partial [Elysia chlorotica]
MFLCKFPTLLTPDLAAPEELTVAVVHLLLDKRLVAPPTAHELAAVQARAVLLTLATAGAQGALLGLVLAEVRRLSQVDEVLLGGALVEVGDALQPGSGVVPAYHARAVKLVLEQAADAAEWLHLAPAHLHGAVPRDAVALAHDPHLFFHR